jgi:Co/Zn/Cd efflux system component
MRIELTSNRNVYNCVSVVQEQQPSFPAGYSSSSRITSNLISRIIKNKSIDSNSSLSTNNTDTVTNHGVLSQQQQQVETEEGLADDSGSSKRGLCPFEVSSSCLSQSADSSGHSGDAFLHTDKNDDSDSSGSDGDRHPRGLNIPGNNHDATSDDKHCDGNQDGQQQPSNERLLGTAFMSFMTFSLIQLCFAFIAGSQAMKGDSAAMIVDSMTYLSNWIAEKRKSTFDQTYIPPPPPTPTLPLFLASLSSPDNHYDPVREAKRLKERARRKMVLKLEIVPPLISVSALIGITIVVLKQAIHVLLMDRYRQRKDQTDPNIQVMLAFSTCNLALDALNVFCFAKAKHLMGFQTLPSPDPHHHPHSTTATATSTTMGDLIFNGGGGDGDNKSTSTKRMSGSYLEIDQSSSHDDDDDDCNNLSTPATCKDEKHHSQQQEQELNHVDTSPKSGDRDVELSTVIRQNDYGDKSSHGDGEETNLNMVRSSHCCKIFVFNRFLFVLDFFSISHDVFLTCQCSAYTHVFADTLRSIAVIIAAIIAVLVKNVTPEEADASAAVAVSILILLSLIPLFQGLLQSLIEFSAIRAEEQAEQMFADTRGIETIAFRRSNSAAAAAAASVASTNNEVV